jgi:predicted DNA-binding protein
MHATEWYRPTGPQAENRDHIYNRLIRSLPQHVVNDIEYFVRTAIETKLADKEKELVAREASLKVHEAHDRKREDDITKRARELEETIRNKALAIRLGEAQIALFEAQGEAELEIMRKLGPYGRFMPFRM